MRSSPLVSVILPTYNRAALLSRAIRSVLDQTYPNWELIIWDDGSSDRTQDVVASHADARIRYYRSENHGVAWARNQAINTSHGQYVAFLDSDDEWLPAKLKLQVEAFEMNSVDMLFSDFINHHEEIGARTQAFPSYRDVMRSLQVDLLPGELVLIKAGLLESLAIENFIATDTVMVRREILTGMGGFQESLQNAEDFELWWRLGLTDARFAFHEHVLMIRHKPGGTLSAASLDSCENRLSALDLCRQEALLHGRQDLIKSLGVSYRNTWQIMIPLLALQGDRRGMLKAFFQSLEYGFRPGTVRLLLNSLFG